MAEMGNIVGPGCPLFSPRRHFSRITAPVNAQYFQAIGLSVMLEAFVDFCSVTGYLDLQAQYKAVRYYLGCLFQEEKLQCGSIRL